MNDTLTDAPPPPVTAIATTGAMPENPPHQTSGNVEDSAPEGAPTPQAADVPKTFFQPSRFLPFTGQKILAFILFGLIFWLWWQDHAQLNELSRLNEQVSASFSKNVRENKESVDKIAEQVEVLQRHYGTVESRLEEFQAQAESLRALYQEATISRDDALLAEAEQNINIAAQQLQLSGNVQSAIIALSIADNRLSRLEQPRFLLLRRALARDLEQLRMTPFVDISGISLRLETVMTSIDHLPLTLPRLSPPPAEKPADIAEHPSWWDKLLAESWQEIKGMVRIRRFDHQEPVLLSQDQALALRENIRLRLLNARLALFSRDQWTFHNELEMAASWMGRYFNTEEKQVQATLETLKQLGSTEIAVEYPALHDSLAALQTLKTERETGRGKR